MSNKNWLETLSISSHKIIFFSNLLNLASGDTFIQVQKQLSKIKDERGK